MDMDLKDGGILGFSGSHYQSDFINLVTYGIPRYSLSHVGILARKNKRSKWLVFEANEDVPWQCAVTHRKHDGVQAHSLDLLLERYPGKMWLYRLNEEYIYKYVGWQGAFGISLYYSLVKELGTPYDWMGAKRAGGFFHSAIHALLYKQDTSSLFCSELVAMILNEYGILDTNNVSKWSPNRLMRHLVRKHIYDKAVRLK
ncbi:MAG: hypothetical protein WC455_24085 [Dehalococcoidia bacterium]|jgi:hypothetical protein